MVRQAKNFCLIFILVILDSQIAWGEDYHLLDGKWLDVDESYVEYRKYETYRNAYIPDQKNWDFTGHFHNTYSIYHTIYWQTDLHLSATTDQVMYGGLEYYLGVHALPWIDVFKYHHSEHAFDHTEEYRFPVEDSYGVRVYFKK